MAVYNLDNTSSGVPSLGVTAGSFITLFDYLLVTTMGWSKPFTGTNIAVYKQPAGTNQRYLRINDSEPNYAVANMYETMTDVNTGTNPSANVILWRQTNNAEWYFHSNGKIFWFSWNFSNNVYSNYFYFSSFLFGDFISFVQNDQYNTIISGYNRTDTPSDVNYLQRVCSSGGTTEQQHLFFLRSYTQLGGSVSGYKISMLPFLSSTDYLGSKGSLPYPHAPDGTLKISMMYLLENGNNIRGYLPGIWIPMHTNPITHGSEFTGNSGILTGRTFKTFRKQFQGYSWSGNNEFSYFYETSDTWGGL